MTNKFRFSAQYNLCVMHYVLVLTYNKVIAPPNNIVMSPDNRHSFALYDPSERIETRHPKDVLQNELQFASQLVVVRRRLI